ncbi:hypothetical protein BDB00DRAFT_792955 [Zychaea mexicana]|uniref:uncharacterized protein n=1 Tax=Zychaea mexicana TaxID=64656 RepID=UPI0022FDE3F4|nr:uncharacterized protein BDB00DRAFT_904969 [Zychaea mexicana]XP_052973355.1 uncharacterized protein BDB00DRAFT_792955 [Zychaea mexicana]KAI9466436.1 hypothetical protein BDB00DRAFT_904969 [Zychaea mexicana]KAI9484342.1 hypothetical protein BDB00DRAFT_792955 [Zychaea mexicana]
MAGNIATTLTKKFIEYFDQETEAPSLAHFYCYDNEAFIKGTPNTEYKATWSNRFKKAVQERNIVDYRQDKPNWEEIQQELENNLENKPTPKTSPKSRSPTLKTKLMADEKTKLKAIFEDLDPKNFWYLKSTISEPNQKAKSVEERMIKFALNCNYYHPSQQLILDLTDSNWDDIFTKAERKEIEDAGCKLLRPVDVSLTRLLGELYKKKTAKEAFNFARTIELDPEDEPILAWLSTSI